MVNYQNLTCNLAWTKFRGLRTNRRHPNTKVLGPRGCDIGSLTRVTVGVSSSDLDFTEGVGRRTQELASQRAGLLDWLAKGAGDDNVSTGVNIILGEL